MTNVSNQRCLLWMAVVVCALIAAPRALAQAPSNYGAYFSQSAGMRGAESANRYLYDKYFYQRATVSPYINLARPGSDSSFNYQMFVRPEQERREAASKASMAYVQQRKLQGNVGHTALPGAGFMGGTINDAIMKPAMPKATTPSSYYNHWYGGWANR
jgi:hypothetical protein